MTPFQFLNSAAYFPTNQKFIWQDYFQIMLVRTTIAIKNKNLSGITKNVPKVAFQ